MFWLWNCFKTPRIRNGKFYPVSLNELREEDEKHRKLTFSLYRRGLIIEKVSDVYEEIYGKEYSKQQISYLMKESREEVPIWLKKKLKFTLFGSIY